MAGRDRRDIAARIDRTNHVPVPINVIAPAGHMTAPRPAAETFQKSPCPRGASTYDNARSGLPSLLRRPHGYAVENRLLDAVSHCFEVSLSVIGEMDLLRPMLS